MQFSRNTRARNVIIAGVVIALAGRLLGWSLTSIFLALVALIVVLSIYYFWRTWRTLGWYRTYHAFVMRVHRGEAEAVIDELTQARAQGDTSPMTALTLAAAYTHLGRGTDADPLALEAFTAITAQDCTGGDHNGDGDFTRRASCDTAYLTYYDALMVQGRYITAASTLRSHMNEALNPPVYLTLTAWAYFLGAEHDTAREVLSKVTTTWPGHRDMRPLSPRFLILLAYLRHQLHNTPLDELRSLASNLNEWDDYAARNAANPYGESLVAIADEIRALLGQPAITYED